MEVLLWGAMVAETLFVSEWMPGRVKFVTKCLELFPLGLGNNNE